MRQPPPYDQASLPTPTQMLWQLVYSLTAALALIVFVRATAQTIGVAIPPWAALVCMLGALLIGYVAPDPKRTLAVWCEFLGREKSLATSATVIEFLKISSRDEALLRQIQGLANQYPMKRHVAKVLIKPTIESPTYISYMSVSRRLAERGKADMRLAVWCRQSRLHPERWKITIAR